MAFDNMDRKPTCKKNKHHLNIWSVLNICRYFSQYSIRTGKTKKLAYYIYISRYVQKYGCKTLPVMQNGPAVRVVSQSVALEHKESLSIFNASASAQFFILCTLVKYKHWKKAFSIDTITYFVLLQTYISLKKTI